MPPITPTGCFADTISSIVFDDIWADVTACFRGALRQLCARPQLATLQSLSRITLGESLGCVRLARNLISRNLVSRFTHSSILLLTAAKWIFLALPVERNRSW